MEVTLIEDAERLDAWLPSETARGSLAIDTEFVRERTYYAQLGLVQVAGAADIALIDPLGAGVGSAIARMLKRCPEAIMHSASEDLEALRVACECLPVQLFDTQIAAGIAGMGAGLSLQKLIEACVGVVLPKSETRTDWLRRPLSPAQLAYAADDVRHLAEAASILVERLSALGRLAWAQEDCQRMLQAAREDAANPHPHLAFRPAQRMSAAAQLRVRRLLLWRDGEARRANKPRGWIIDNALVTRLAERPPTQREALEQLLDSTPGAPRKHRERLWDELQREPSEDERDLPLALSADSLDRSALKRMQDAVARLAQTLDLPEGVLAPRRHLEALLAERVWPEALQGWRRPLLEPVIGFALA
jgi:ribonuclease D